MIISFLLKSKWIVPLFQLVEMNMKKKNPWSHRFYDFKQMWSSENDFSDYKLRLLL